MKGQKFHYRVSILPDGEDRRPLCPRIPISLTGSNGESIENMGIIDSGSTETFIGKDIADILELELGEEMEINTANGNAKGRESSITIEVPMRHNPVKLVNMPCCVLEELDEIILGRRGFFIAFEITFCEYERWISLKDIRSKANQHRGIRK